MFFLERPEVSAPARLGNADEGVAQNSLASVARRSAKTFPMSMPARPRSVCVYCGSSDAAPASYYRLAETFGAACAQRGYRLVNGGGRVGLMGAAARACRAAGGATLGVIPHVLINAERVDRDGAIIEVASMHERKQRMFDESDAFVVLPGGVGTLDEALEMITWRGLGIHAKAIIFLDEDDYWAPFFALISHGVEAGLVAPSLAASIGYAKSVEVCFRLLEAETSKPPDA
jgi:hypothetical protein